MNFNMVAIQQVGGNSGRGTPFPDRPELGAVRSRTTEEVTWEEAETEESTLLKMMSSLYKQVLHMEARWSQCQEKKKRLQKSEEDKTEISDRSRPDINVRSVDIAGISGNPTLSPGIGDDPLSRPPKVLEVPPQDTSPSMTEERYSYSPDGGEERKKATQQVELRIPGMLLPVKVDGMDSLMMSMSSENEKTKRNLERVFQEKDLMVLHRFKEQQVLAEDVNNKIFSPDVGGLGVGGKEGSEELNRYQPLPKRDNVYTAFAGSNWLKIQLLQDKSRAKETKLDSMEEALGINRSKHEEGDDGNPLQPGPDTSDDTDESEEERVKKKHKLKEEIDIVPKLSALEKKVEKAELATLAEVVKSSDFKADLFSEISDSSGPEADLAGSSETKPGLPFNAMSEKDDEKGSSDDEDRKHDGTAPTTGDQVHEPSKSKLLQCSEGGETDQLQTSL